MGFELGFLSGVTFVILLGLVVEKLEKRRAVKDKQIRDYDDHGYAAGVGQK